MSSEPDRNPSPPPELKQNDQDFLPDKVGDSVYSKQGLFRVLFNIVESVQVNPTSEVAPGENKESIENTDDIVELDPELEEEACILWDMSASIPVATFLHEFKASEILLDVIDQTKSPRLVEIIVGIFGNMASFNDICLSLTNNKSFVNTIISLSGTSDAPTIIQVLRLIHTAIVNENTRNLWLEALTNHSSFMENLKYILENSLNGDILKGALELMYYIFDEDENTCAAWNDEGHAKALLSAGKQLMMREEHTGLDEFWLVLNILCQYEANSKAFVENYESLRDVFQSYFMKFGDHDDVLPKSERVVAVAACFSTYSTILRSVSMDAERINEEFILLGILFKMYVSVCEVITKVREMNCEKDQKEENESLKSGREEDMVEKRTDSESTAGESSSADEETEHKNWILLQEAMRNMTLALAALTDPEESAGKLLQEILNMTP